ncbi:MAG: DUF3466 family protein [Phycisphaerae bacterium]|nr:DUF3466 family protein [Phycisphaerae bacterium]
MSRVFCIVSSGAVVLMLALAAPVVGVQYPVTDLGRLDPDANYPAAPMAINDAGQVVGLSSVKVTYLFILQYYVPRAFRWAGGTISGLGTLPGSGTMGMSFARSINNANQVVGVNIGTLPLFGGDTSHNHAFLWQNNAMTDLGSMTADPNDVSLAFAINSAGHTVGSLSLLAEPNVPHAFLRWQNGLVTSLGTLGGSSSLAWDINDSNQVVGSSKDASDRNRGFIWQDGVMSNLGALPDYEADSQALAINESGQVIGISSDANDATRSFLWQNGSMTDLGLLPGYPNIVAAAINDKGVIVGAAADPNGQTCAFLWNKGSIYDLNSLVDPGWNLTTATAINNAGHIVGTATQGGLKKGYLIKTYLLSLTVNSPDKGTVDVDPNAVFFDPNAAVTLTATANQSKSFVDWSGDVPVGHETDNPLTITMDSSKAVTANFKCGSGLEPILPLILVGLLSLTVVRRWRK